MPHSPEYRAQPWLKSPLRTPLGEIQLAGLLHNVQGIDPVRLRTLSCFTLVLMVSGRGYYRDQNSIQHDLAPGNVILVFPGVAHAYGPVDNGEWTQVYVVFAGPQFDLWRSTGIITPARPVWKVGSPDYWRQRLFEVAKDEPGHPSGMPLRAMGRFLHVLSEMAATDAENDRDPGRDPWLETAVRLLGDRGTSGWLSAREVSKHVGLNYDNFRKRFTQLTGESPMRYQKRRRIDWACAAIYHGEASLKQIADELGFCDVFHFSKAFKQATSFAPSEYRRRVRGR
ncbi:hypothetical protein DB347_02100 [Opitutaceae bacterium EW11]|nr:hypothetical protein DB347_02100 [Opitutaceae bacterium EW11]